MSRGNNSALKYEDPQSYVIKKHADLSLKSIEALAMIIGDYHPRNFRIVLWDGSSIEPERGENAQFTLTFNHPQALRKLLSSPTQLSLCEGYIFGDYDLEGDLRATVSVGEYIAKKSLSWMQKAKIALLLRALGRAERAENTIKIDLNGSLHSRARDRRAVSYHYDVSNDFYALWLDRRMVYSCGYFVTEHESLDDAQEQKLDHICRKLRLKPGETLLDIGCGWGALLIHAAKHYGVRATGVTLSKNQARLAIERIRQEGFSEQCEALLLDYRDLDKKNHFDKIVSVGMFEHTGRNQFATYFKKVWHMLKPGGVFLNHAINEPPAENANTEPTMVSTYVFPDGELVPLYEAQAVAEKIGFEVRDVESLREHYALTLSHWVKRLEKNQIAARLATNEVIYRIWRLYMAGCSAAFRSGKIQVYQSLYLKPKDNGENDLPLTRRDWYA